MEASRHRNSFSLPSSSTSYELKQKHHEDEETLESVSDRCMRLIQRLGGILQVELESQETVDMNEGTVAKEHKEGKDGGTEEGTAVTEDGEATTKGTEDDKGDAMTMEVEERKGDRDGNEEGRTAEGMRSDDGVAEHEDGKEEVAARHFDDEVNDEEEDDNDVEEDDDEDQYWDDTEEEEEYWRGVGMLPNHEVADFEEWENGTSDEEEEEGGSPTQEEWEEDWMTDDEDGEGGRTGHEMNLHEDGLPREWEDAIPFGSFEHKVWQCLMDPVTMSVMMEPRLVPTTSGHLCLFDNQTIVNLLRHESPPKNPITKEPLVGPYYKCSQVTSLVQVLREHVESHHVKKDHVQHGQGGGGMKKEKQVRVHSDVESALEMVEEGEYGTAPLSLSMYTPLQRLQGNYRRAQARLHHSEESGSLADLQLARSQASYFQYCYDIDPEPKELTQQVEVLAIFLLIFMLTIVMYMLPIPS